MFFPSSWGGSLIKQCFPLPKLDYGNIHCETVAQRSRINRKDVLKPDIDRWDVKLRLCSYISVELRGVGKMMNDDYVFYSAPTAIVTLRPFQSDKNPGTLICLDQNRTNIESVDLNMICQSVKGMYRSPRELDRVGRVYCFLTALSSCVCMYILTDITVLRPTSLEMLEEM